MAYSHIFRKQKRGVICPNCKIERFVCYAQFCNIKNNRKNQIGLCRKCTHKNPWNKKTKGLCKPNLGSFQKGFIPLTAWKKGRKPWNKGGIMPLVSEETRQKLSDIQRKLVLNGKHHLWKGGVYKTNQQIRLSWEYRNWRKAILKRDNYICQICGIKGLELHADHIKAFAYYPELRFELSNGRTLCKECHMKTENYLWKAIALVN